MQIRDMYGRVGDDDLEQERMLLGHGHQIPVGVVTRNVVCDQVLTKPATD